jgi:signal recognition particle GTPase
MGGGSPAAVRASPPPPGLALEKRAHLVAIVGNDGAGKTTQAERLAAWLARRGRSVTLHPNESLRPSGTR